MSSSDEKRWGKGHLRQPEEETTHLWASRELITPDEWTEMERAHPASLKDIAATLDLPVAAAVYRARAHEVDRPATAPAAVLLDAKALGELGKPVTGTGGHQSFIRSLQRGLEGETLSLTRKDFNRIREYLLRTGGGFRSRYQALMDCCLTAIEKAGGLDLFFREDAPT